MNTIFLLMAEFETPTIPLEKVREKYFGITNKAAAARLAKEQGLPVPVFRLGSQKSGWFIHIKDLAEHIDKTALEQKTLWQKMNAA